MRFAARAVKAAQSAFIGAKRRALIEEAAGERSWLLAKSQLLLRKVVERPFQLTATNTLRLLCHGLAFALGGFTNRLSGKSKLSG